MCAYLVHEHNVHVQKLFSVGIHNPIILETLPKILKLLGAENSHRFFEIVKEVYPLLRKIVYTFHQIKFCPEFQGDHMPTGGYCHGLH